MYCCVPGCTSRYGKDKISFHQFPKNNGARLERWIQAVGKMSEASSGSFVCGRHFVGGKAARNGDVDSPDWVPSLFLDGCGGGAGSGQMRRTTSDFGAPRAAKVEEGPLDFDDEPNVRCLVRGCAMARDDFTQMQFFPVPAAEPDRTRWFDVMGIGAKGGPPAGSRPPAAVCELHFELAKDLANYDDYIMQGATGVLREGVVPTRNVPGTVPAVQDGGNGEGVDGDGDGSLLQEMSLPMDTNGDDELMPEYPDHMQASPVEEFVHVCRSCLSTDKTNLVSGYDDNLADIFFQFTSVAIDRGEGISTEFCQDCKNRLMELHFFRDTCLTSTQILLHRYQKAHGISPDDEDQGDDSMMDSYRSEYGNGSIAGHSFATDDPEDLLMPQKEETFWDKSSGQKRRGRPPRQSLLEATSQADGVWIDPGTGKRKLVKKRYNCKVCFKEYNSRVGLDTHQATHKDDNPEEFTVPCEKCPVMRRPGDKHSCHVNAMRCHVCSDQFRSWSYLKIHLAKVHRIKTKRRELMAMMNITKRKRGRPGPSDVLDISGNVSANSTLVNSTTITSPSTPQQQQQSQLTTALQKPEKCGFCEAVFKNRTTLETHLRTHSLVQPTECTECGETFDCFRSLERHFDQHADHNSDNKSGLVNKCHLCGKVVRRRQTLMLHRQYVHCDRDVVKCSTCPRLFPNGRHLVEHHCPARGKQGGGGGDNNSGGINGDFIIVKPESILKGVPSYEEPRRAPPPANADGADPLLGLGEDVIELGSDDDDEEEEDDESSNQTAKSAHTCTVCGKVFEKEDVLERHMKLHRMMSAANARK